MTDQPTERVASELVERIERAMQDSQATYDGSVWMHPSEAQLHHMVRAILPILQAELAARDAAIVAWHRREGQCLHELAVVEGEKEPAEFDEKFFRHLIDRTTFHTGAAAAIERGEYKEQSA